MSEQADILDFNELHRVKTSKQNEIFSMTKIKEILTIGDVDKCVESISLPQTRNFVFPSNLDKAILHQQSCYIQPREKYLKESRETKCDCCGQVLRRKRYNIFTCDMYEIFAPEYGISIPLYFTIMKLQFIIMLLLVCIFGIYFWYISNKYCNVLDQNNDQEKKLFEQNCSFLLITQYFLLHNFYQQKERHNSTFDQNTYYILGYVAYLIMMLTPFIHQIVLQVEQVRHWMSDSQNPVHYPKLTLYIKHIPKRFTQQEIQQYMQNAIDKYLNAKDFIKEIVYILDTSQIKDLNEKRIEAYLKLLQTVEEIKQSPRLELKSQLVECAVQVIKLTKDVQTTLAVGLPFTQKIILKFDSEAVTRQVYEFYHEFFLKNMREQIQMFKDTKENYKELKKQKIELKEQLMQNEKSDVKSSFIQQEQEEVDFRQSMMKLYQLNQEYQKQFPQQEQEIDENRGLHLQWGFRQEDIIWENLGMHSLQRLSLRIITTAITLLAGVLSMGLFDLLFVEVQNLKKQSGFLATLLIMIITLVTVILNVLSTIIVIIMTKKAKRVTYSKQERNIATFMTPIQQICVLAFPLIFLLSIVQSTSALNSVSVIKALNKLSLIRVIAKFLLQIFHLRLISFNGKKKLIAKKFKPTNYFQKQLNQKLSPPIFPMRSRLLTILLIFSTGLIMTFLDPFILIWCLALLLVLFYCDKYGVLNQYQCDKLFTFELQEYQIRIYQYVMMPCYCYMYIITFTTIFQITSNQDADYTLKLITIPSVWTYLGYGTLIVTFLSFAFLRKQIANFFVFKILRYPEPRRDSQIFVEKSYLQCYNEYFDNLGIDELTTQLEDTFEKIQYKSQ